MSVKALTETNIIF